MTGSPTIPEFDAPAYWSKSDTPVEYRDILGLIGYRVGSDGSVWSCHLSHGTRHYKRYGQWHRVKGGRRTGYPILVVRIGGKRRWWFIHRLVLEAFVGPRPDGKECCHQDGNKENNAISNLRWDTHASNVADNVRDGSLATGSRVGLAKMTETDIPEIVRLYREVGLTQAEIAKRFGVHPTQITRVLNGKQWRRASGCEETHVRGDSFTPEWQQQKGKISASIRWANAARRRNRAAAPNLFAGLD